MQNCNWIDNNTGEEFCISDYPKAFGFIYVIAYTNGQMYIGKRNFFDKVVLPKNSNRKKKEIIWRESTKWKCYTGSSKLSKGLEILRKTIVNTANTRRALTYLEVELLFKHNAMFDDRYLNENIGGVYHQNVFDELKVPLKKEYR